ncbi:RyR domain-containing protein [Spiribacter roseus]|uniref:RyR domain-containing protein n=1 Tax=Spiribacter roseus TaxID=1855875 RepID=UPI0011D12084
MGNIETFLTWVKRFEWWIVGALAFLASILGYIGFRLHYATLGVEAPPLDLIYGVFQLFSVANPVSAEGATVLSAPNAFIQIARYLAPGTVAYSVIRLVAAAVTDAASKLSVASLEGHAVVCGLTDRGKAIARSLLTEGHTVVVVENDTKNPYLGELKAAGVKVIYGSPLDKIVLKSGRVQTASKIAVMAADERENYGVASKCVELIEEQRRKNEPGRETQIRALAGPDFSDFFKDAKPFGTSTSVADARFFDPDITAARQIAMDASLANFENFFDNHRQPKILIVGEGRFSASLISMAIKQLQYPHCGVPTIDFMSPDLNQFLEEFPHSHPQLSLVSAVSFHEKSRGALLSDELGLVDRTSGRLYDLAIVALDDPFASIKFARRLNQQALIAATSDDSARMDHVVCIKPSVSFPTVRPDLPIYEYGRFFNVTEIGCSSSSVFDEEIDAEARKAHESYLMHIKNRQYDPSKPATAPWPELKEEYKAANRRTIDHDRIKRDALARDSSCEMIEALAEAEHRSWMADKIIAGWRFGPCRDDVNKLHPSLVAYGDLSVSEKQKDVEKVNRLIALEQRN